jgi:two-component system, NarL family, sensor histidine kinase DesK
MQQLPAEIKLTYIIALLVLFILVFFILFISRLFNKKQANYLLQQQVLEQNAKLQILQSKIDQQQALDEERKRISYDMHDDLGSGLSSIKLISNALKKKQSEISSIDELIEIENQATKLTTSMRELVWALNPSNDTLQQFILYITQYATIYFDKLPLQLNIYRSDLPTEDVFVNGVVRKNLLLIIKEVFNNIVKHSHATKVDFTYVLKEHQLLITIKDNGIGLPVNNNLNTGITSITNRAALCNGQVQFNNLAKGLEVVIAINVS